MAAFAQHKRSFLYRKTEVALQMPLTGNLEGFVFGEALLRHYTNVGILAARMSQLGSDGPPICL